MAKTKPTVSTGGGDLGMTGLFQGGKVHKNDPQIVASGDCDELSCAIGTAKALCDDAETRKLLEEIQHDLITLMGEISLNRYSAEVEEFKLDPKRVGALEKIGLKLEKELPPLKDWDLPGRNELAAAFHTARAVARRCERSAWAVPEGHRASPESLVYLNRLSDLLWLLARDAAR